MKQQLYKTTDRILNRMTPEELARYANRLCDQQAKAQNDGKITAEECNKEITVFVRKQINSLSTSEYIRFMKAMIKDADITNARRLTLAHLHILDLKISILELGIEYAELLEALLKETSSHSAVPEKSEDNNNDMMRQARKKAKLCLEQIDHLKKEREAVLSYPCWEHLGVSLM